MTSTKTIPEGNKAGLLISLLLFSSALLIFIISPVRSLGETQYTMMLGYTLLHQRTFALDRKELRVPDQLEMIGNTTKVKGLPLEVVNGRVYKYAPPGSTILSLPFLGTANLFAQKPVDAAGLYDQNRELKLSSILAALLMAVWAVLCFQFARLFLPVWTSFALAIAATFGTQIWSTASRVVEPDTWSVVLLMVALYLLVANELGKVTLNPVLLATILSWCYFVHPTSSISIIVISAYIWLYHRQYFLHFAVTGLLWFLLLIVYAWQNFGQLLPNYFQASRLGFETFWEALAGNIISPSRGLLVYVPVLVIIGFILLREKDLVPVRRLVVAGLAVISVHLFVISGFSHWWAGHSYGPRYWTSIVPWFVLLSTCALAPLVNQSWGNKSSRFAHNSQIVGLVILSVAGILIHSRGALSQETRLWNSRPYDIDLRAGRLWNWRYPQFLAGLIYPPLPAGGYPVIKLNEPLDLTSNSTDGMLWYGWSNPEPGIRWTEDRRVALIFALETTQDLTMTLRAAPFVVTGLRESQRVSFKLNGQQIDWASLNQAKATDLVLTLPKNRLKRENVILFELPDAESPAKLGLSDDSRLLGLAVQWIEFKSVATSEQ